MFEMCVLMTSYIITQADNRTQEFWCALSECHTTSEILQFLLLLGPSVSTEPVSVEFRAVSETYTETKECRISLTEQEAIAISTVFQGNLAWCLWLKFIVLD